MEKPITKTEVVSVADASGKPVKTKMATITGEIEHRSPSHFQRVIHVLAQAMYIGERAERHKIDTEANAAHEGVRQNLGTAAAKACASDPKLIGVTTKFTAHVTEGGLWTSKSDVSHDSDAFLCHKGKAIPVQNGLPKISDKTQVVAKS